MLRSTKQLLGYRLDAADDVLGTVKDLLFDEDNWTIRWFVADTGKWLPGRKVLIPPLMVGTPEWDANLLPVRLTKEEVENSPGLEYDEPVSRQYERRYYDQFGWPYYWAGTGVWGMHPTPTAMLMRENDSDPMTESPEAGTNLLRSVLEVMNYRIQATDDAIGHVEDFIVDSESWTLRYLVVDTRNWLPGRKVLVATDWIQAVQWPQSQVTVELTRDAIKGSPEYDPATPVNRAYEERLYDYYGRPYPW